MADAISVIEGFRLVTVLVQSQMSTTTTIALKWLRDSTILSQILRTTISA
jgi:hypothetical protein